MARHFGIVWGALSRVSLSPRFSDPLGEVRKLYDFLRMTLTPDTESAFRHYLEDVPKNAKFRGHKYTMEQFDLTKEDLQGEFKEYIDHMIRKGFPEEDILWNVRAKKTLAGEVNRGPMHLPAWNENAWNVSKKINK